MNNDSPIHDIHIQTGDHIVHDARYVYLKGRFSEMDDTIHDLKDDVKKLKIIMAIVLFVMAVVITVAL
jgi:hypothetical protein